MNDQGKHSQAKPVSVKGKVSDAEWRTRVDLAAAYRLVAAYGWDDLIFTHISARVPDSDHHFLINPYGMLFEEVTASSLVKIDLHGKKVMESPFDINPAGFVIHSAIHAAREDAHCVMHLHTPAGVAVAAQKDGLLPISQQSLFVLASLSYHGYEGVALNDAEKPRLVNDLGKSTFLILPNHGLLTVGGFDRRRVPRHVHDAARLRDPGAGPVGRRQDDPDPASHPRRRRRPAGAGHPRPRRAARLAGAAAQGGPAGCGLSDVRAGRPHLCGGAPRGFPGDAQMEGEESCVTSRDGFRVANTAPL